VRPLAVVGIALAALIVMAAPGCSSPSTASSGGPAAPTLPPGPDLTTPDSAVRSFLDWTSLAYRMANSELASATCTPEWGVHVDSYIQLNRESGAKSLEQVLTKFVKRSESVEGTQATVAAYEEWDYRYFSLDGQKWITPPYKASYDTTYTLVLDGERWLVDDVSANALTELK
jgi:hypothetical protein